MNDAINVISFANGKVLQTNKNPDLKTQKDRKNNYELFP